MKVESNIVNNDTGMTIVIHGRFDFSVANEFRNCYRNESVKSDYFIDLSDVVYMDSAAIGMILLLREFSEDKGTIKMINCSDSIKKIIAMSHIDRFVEISGWF